MLTKQPFIMQLKVPEGILIKEVMEFPEIKKLYSEIGCVTTKIGIYGKITNLETTLHQNDRIEIYKPLTIDPKEKRKIKIKSKRAKYKNHN